MVVTPPPGLKRARRIVTEFHKLTDEMDKVQGDRSLPRSRKRVQVER
jgi:hypothetical protein